MDRKVARAALPWWRRKAMVVAVALIIASLAIWQFLPERGSTNITSAEMSFGEVSRAPFADYLPIRAIVSPKSSTLVTASYGGQVESLLVQDGAMVQAGQPLARLVNPALRMEVLTREAQIAAQLGDLSGQDLDLERNRLDRDAKIAQANYDLIKAQRELGLRERLRNQGLVSEAGMKSYEQETSYQKARLAQLQSGKAEELRIASAQAARLAETRKLLSGNLAAVRSNLDSLIVTAPVTGRLTNLTMQLGQSLKPGDQVGQIDSEATWKLVADVDEFYLNRLVVGQEASGDSGIRLNVIKVLPAVDSGRFRVELGFVGPAKTSLKRGQTLDIRVTLGSTAPALVAQVGSWLDGNVGSFVFVVDKDGRHARRKTIRIGRRNPEQVEILYGLSAGDRIVTSNISSLKGDLLNIR